MSGEFAGKVVVVTGAGEGTVAKNNAEMKYSSATESFFLLN